jgi:hypothetical protein
MSWYSLYFSLSYRLQWSLQCQPSAYLMSCCCVLSCRPRRRSAWTLRDTSGYPFEERKEPGLRLPRVECTVRVCV